MVPIPSSILGVSEFANRAIACGNSQHSESLFAFLRLSLFHLPTGGSLKSSVGSAIHSSAARPWNELRNEPPAS